MTQCILKHQETLESRPCREGAQEPCEYNWWLSQEFREKCFPVEPTVRFRIEKRRKASSTTASHFN